MSDGFGIVFIIAAIFMAGFGVATAWVPVKSKKPIRPEIHITFDNRGIADTTYVYKRP